MQITIDVDASDYLGRAAACVAALPVTVREIERAAAEELLPQCQALCPIGATHLLYDSLHIEEDADGVLIIDDAPYAVYVHENYALHHPNGGQAGFIREPVMAHGYETMARAAQARLLEGW
jgi:hypothetical protein